MECNWGDLPGEVSVDCRHLLQSILCEKLDTRLGTPTTTHSSSSSSSASSSPNTVLRHPFFRPIDFSVLYEVRSPYQDVADSFSLGLEGSCYWLDERRAVVPSFEKEELVRSQWHDYYSIIIIIYRPSLAVTPSLLLCYPMMICYPLMLYYPMMLCCADNLTDEEKSHLENDPYSDFNFIE
jgi:hypothetical protein